MHGKLCGGELCGGTVFGGLWEELHVWGAVGGCGGGRAVRGAVCGGAVAQHCGRSCAGKLCGGAVLPRNGLSVLGHVYGDSTFWV